MASLLVCKSHEGVDKDVERVLESPLTTSVLPTLHYMYMMTVCTPMYI